MVMSEFLHNKTTEQNTVKEILHDTFGDVSQYYFDAIHAAEDIIVTRQKVIDTVGITLYKLSKERRPKQEELIRDAALFSAESAQEVISKFPHQSQDIINFFGNIAQAAAGAEYTEIQGETVLHIPVTQENRILRNRGVGDRVIALYNEALSAPFYSAEVILSENIESCIQTKLAAD